MKTPVEGSRNDVLTVVLRIQTIDIHNVGGRCDRTDPGVGSTDNFRCGDDHRIAGTTRIGVCYRSEFGEADHFDEDGALSQVAGRIHRPENQFVEPNRENRPGRKAL